LAAINRDEKGNILSVNLETPEGRKRAFRGDVAEDIAYQIHLKELDKNNEHGEFEDFINTDPESRKEIEDGGPEEAANKGTGEDNAEVQRSKIEKVSSQSKTNKNEKNSKSKSEKERTEKSDQGQSSEQGTERQRDLGGQGKENGDGLGTNREEQNVLDGNGPAKAESEETGPSQNAQETKENHLDAIRNIEKKADRISAKDLENPDQVKKPVLKNIAAKELGKESLTDAEKKIADARRADIDNIKVNDEARRFDSKLSDADRERSDELKRKVDLIDKYGVDDIVKYLKDNKLLETQCP
jgi:hypothetical protein